MVANFEQRHLLSFNNPNEGLCGIQNAWAGEITKSPTLKSKWSIWAKYNNEVCRVDCVKCIQEMIQKLFCCN